MEPTLAELAAEGRRAAEEAPTLAELAAEGARPVDVEQVKAAAGAPEAALQAVTLM